MFALDISGKEIKEKSKILPQRLITQRTLIFGKCIAKIAQWHVVEILKLVLMPLRVSNYYLIKAEVLDELFKKLDNNSIYQINKNNA